jgi:signal transduction histidine kinase
MLLLLHLGTSWGLASPLSRSLMLAHLGLFVLWQPIWRGDQRLDAVGGIIFLVFTIGFVTLINGWLLACWLILIVGLVGGRTLNSQAERFVYMLTLLFLISKLLIVVVPLLFPARDMPEVIALLGRYGLLTLPCLIATLPTRITPQRSRYAVDLFRGMTAALMAALVALGSVVTMYRTNAGYADALIQTSLVLAGFLFAISWLLTPGSNAGGLAELWERSLLNIGTPFEEWLSDLAKVAEEHNTPAQFLPAAMRALVQLPWVRGVEWKAEEIRGFEGRRTRYALELSAAGIDVQLFVQRRPSPTLLLHGRLLVQLLAHFYTAKQREQELAKQAHLQAIYETGARVTHDIKNLLQSLHAMTLVLEREQRLPEQGERRRTVRAQHFIERQLPLITQRLQLALDKLQSPGKISAEQRPLRDWYEALVARNQNTGTTFHAEIMRDPLIPTDLFDSVVENLLENARFKRQVAPGVEIRVDVYSDDNDLTVRVTDTGARVPEEAVPNLFKRPVSSHAGLGVGLFQSARQADALGYALSLQNNEKGCVTFELRRRPDLSATDQYSLFTTG